MRPPHSATVLRGSAVQPKTASEARPPHLASVIQKAKTSYDKLRRKQKFASWQEVDQIWGKYTISVDNWEWIRIGKALGCELPPKVGHARGKGGDNQAHVNNAVTFYVTEVVQPAAHRLHPNRKRKQLYQDIVL